MSSFLCLFCASLSYRISHTNVVFASFILVSNFFVRWQIVFNGYEMLLEFLYSIACHFCCVLFPSFQIIRYLNSMSKWVSDCFARFIKSISSIIQWHSVERNRKLPTQYLSNCSFTAGPFTTELQTNHTVFPDIIYLLNIENEKQK